MGLGPLSVCSHGVFMEGNVSSSGPSFLHRRADRRIPGKGLVADSQSKACEPGTDGHQMTFELRYKLAFIDGIWWRLCGKNALCYNNN